MSINNYNLIKTNYHILEIDSKEFLFHIPTSSVFDLQREIALNSERDATFAEEAKKLKDDANNSLATTVKDNTLSLNVSLYLSLSDKVLSNNQKEILAKQRNIS